jgi:arginyl-tRNA synthetase
VAALPPLCRSFKKASSAELVLNIICSEQDLAQQKVSLAMAMLNPEMTGRQYHVSYDLVRLPSGRMSGRRGRYLLADDLYEELKEVIRTTMREKYAAKGEAVSDEFFDSVTHEACS